jgi:hypothetical protein
MATTIQAQRLIDALKECGLKHGRWNKGGDFTVATDIKRIRCSDGRRYSEFGNAMASLCDIRKGAERLLPFVDKLAADGHSVTVLYDSDDRLLDVIVSSNYNPRHLVATFRLATGQWEHRPAVEEER